MASNDTNDLLSLLPNTAYTLAYALPLFVISILLAFAGCFFTLDRTRSFSPASHVQAAPRSGRSLLLRLHHLYLGGGIGGLCAGYAFGVHFSTLLAVIIPNVTSTSPLGNKTFLAVWAISALFCLVLAGRWKYAAIILIGMSGYCTLAIAMSVIVHPSLITRVVLSAVFTTIGALACVLPFPHCSRIALRVAASSLGAFGVTETLALFAQNTAWGNVWERLCVRDGLGWGSSGEKGLSVAFCFLLLAGLASDWYLHRKIGENPDEKWDRYLAEYSTELPNDSRRAGTFAPLVSFWHRLLGKHNPFAPVVQHTGIIFPVDADTKLPVPNTSSPDKITNSHSVFQPDNFPEIPRSKLRTTLLRKKKLDRQTKLSRRMINFEPHNADLSDSEEDVSGGNFFRAQTEASAKLVDSGDHSLLPVSNRLWEVKAGDIPDYSDVQEDIGHAGHVLYAAGKSHWPSGFIFRQPIPESSTFPGPLSPPSGVPPPLDAEDMSKVQHHTSLTSLTTSTQSSITPVEMASVTATPSLIKAVERIQLAQGVIANPSSTATKSSGAAVPNTPFERRNSWDAFWNDVKMKAYY